MSSDFNLARIKLIVSISFFSFCLICISCGQQDKNHSRPSSEKSAIFQNAAAASAQPYASDIGRDIMQAGGNAIDAAIAMQFALAVCYPVAGNIGGGGFMIYRQHSGETYALDFRETAPSSANRDMYLDDNGEVIKDMSLSGPLASGVPGSVDGMWKAFNRFSKMSDWSRLIKPAIELAESGFVLSEAQASLLNKYLDEIKCVNTVANVFTSKDKWKAGDLLVQKQLGKVLRTIAAEGRDGFYTSWVADSIVSTMKDKGIITSTDLSDYEAIWREPVAADYNNYNIISMPPPSSGGIALIQLMNAVKDFPIDSMGFHSIEAVHLIAEAERRVYADRASHLGDPDFVNVPVASLLDSSYMPMRMQDFTFDSANQSEEIAAGEFAESEETTHFSIIDNEGNAVSLTTTINTAYGSKVVVNGCGFFLNNEMDDFSAKPGVPNYFGLVGNAANAIAPGKRMLSSMTPCIVEKDGALHIVVGTPGGSTIITSVFQTLINIIDYNMNAYEATSACRFHHQWLPDRIQVEENCFSEDLVSGLEQLGHQVSTRSSIGKVETLVVDSTGYIEAAADPRGDDAVSGF